MDYKKIKSELQEIVEISKDVPAPFQERCFQLLLERLLEASSIPPKKTPVKEEPVEDVDDEDKTKTKRGEDGALKLPGVVKAFMRRQKVQAEEIETVVMIEDGEFHFVREPDHSNVAKGQNDWALLVALKSAIIDSQFTADPETVRSVVQDKGFYDKGNFETYFKRPKYAAFYKGAMEPLGTPQSLAPAGEAALAALIKTLAGTSGS